MREEQKTVEDLRALVGQYQEIFHNLHEGYILVDEDGGIRDVNPAYCKMIGYTGEELLSMKITDVRPGMSREYQEEFIQDTIAKGSKEFETQHRRKDGKLIDLKVSVAVIEKNGKICLAGFVRDIGRKKKMIRELERSEQEFKSLYNDNPSPVFHLDLEGYLKRANNAFLTLSGYSLKEIQEMHFSQLVVPEEHAKVKRHFKNVLEGIPQENVVRGLPRDGKPLTFRINTFPITVDDEIVGVFGIAHDITENRKAKKRLEESEQRFKSLFRHNPHSVYYMDLEGNFLGLNSKMEELTGYTKEEMTNLNFVSLVSPRDLPKTQQNFKKAVQGEIREYEVTGVTKEGKEKPVRVTNFPMIIGENIVGVFGIAEDLTEKRHVEQKRDESEQRFQSLFRHNPHPVYYFDLEGNFKEVNEKLVEFTGFSREELLEMGFEDFVLPEDLELSKEHFQKAAEGIPGTYEISVFVKNGVKKEVRVTKFPMYVNEEIVGVYGILQDITEKNRIARELKESEERWHRVVEENPKPVQITVNGEIVFINEAGVKLYEAESYKSLVGTSIFEYTHADDIEMVKERKERLENEKPVNQIHINRLITCKGNERFIEVHSVPIQFKGKEAIQTNIYDITDRKKEEDIIQASLREKQILLQEIHHRVKNNMAVISGLLELQAMSTEEENLKSILKQSQMRIYSMAMIHEKLYASKSLAAIRFDEYAEELVEVIVDTVGDIKTEVTVRFRMDSEELNVNQAIPCGLILNELIVNCYKHAFKDQDAGSILIGFSSKNGKIRLLVEDNGVGLPGDFKISSQQSLGMKIIQTLVSQLDGEIDIQGGQDAVGTCFNISFTEDN